MLDSWLRLRAAAWCKINSGRQSAAKDSETFMRSDALRGVAVLSVFGVALCPAQAGGSIALVDALANFDAPPALMAELEAGLRDAGTTKDKIICGAARFGRQWTNLGGGRASPYECPIGGKTLVITGTHEYRDAMGKVLPKDGLGLEQHAASVRDVDITWAWK
jgi:hypothetical protein